MTNALKAVFRHTLPPGVLSLRSRMFEWGGTLLQMALRRLGLNVARLDDYYSPLPSVPALRASRPRWDRPSALRGITYDVGAMERSLSALLESHGPELKTLPPYGQIVRGGLGPGYPEQDGLLLYLMIRDIKPKQYLEVGSGVSTYYCHLAAERNAQEGRPVRIQCIEPYPRKALESINGIELSVRQVQDEPLATFTGLEAGDVLFIDCSHALKIDSDVAYLYLEVLPALPPGIHIHIHDIPFPYNHPYPAEFWIFGQTWPVTWNEAMLLQAFLAFNPRFRIQMSLPLVRFADEQYLKASFPRYRTVEEQPNTFSSLWLKTV